MAGTDDEDDDYDCCWYCVRTIKWAPVLFILMIIFWSYYAYVFELCIYTVEKIWKKVVYLVLYHIVFGMFMWSYWQTVFTKNDAIADKFKLPEREIDTLMHAENEDMQLLILEQFSRHLPNVNRTINGSVRYCEKCKLVKPDRAHHCSVCGTCILKMDHHCPWVNNCIGFNNYKFFVLFLGYALIFCIYGALTSMPYVVNLWHSGKFHILFLFFVALMFAVSLVSLFSYHCYLVLHNRTTLEAFRAPVFATGPDKEGYDLGKMNNIREIFGTEPSLWFFPISSSLGNGYMFPRLQKIDGSEHLLASHTYTEDEERSLDWLS